MRQAGFISDLKRKFQHLKSWYFYGSELAQLVVDLDDLTDDFRDWVEESEDEWEDVQRMPLETLQDQLSDFQMYLDVQLEKEASELENRVEKLQREVKGKEVPDYIDSLLEDLDRNIENFEKERGLVRNAVIKAENELDADGKPLEVARNLADIEEREMENIEKIEGNITSMRRTCVRNNLVKALKISRVLP